MRRALAIAAVAASLAAPVHANPRDIGLTSAARNEVIVVSGTERRGLKIGDRVFQEQQIRTGADSAAQLLFLDETALTVGPNSQLVLDKAVFDPDKKVGELSVRAVTGAFRFISGSSPAGSYTIKTPSGTIGVRGTWFVFLIQNDIIHIMVRHGLVRFCNIAGQCLNVLAGYQIRANDKYISAPTKASHETLDSVVQLWFASTTPGDLANLAPGAGPLDPNQFNLNNPNRHWWQTQRDFQPNPQFNQPQTTTTTPPSPPPPGCDSICQERRFQRKAAIKFTHVLLGLYRYADRKDLSHYDAKFAFFVLLPKVIRLNREIKQIDNKQEFKEFKRDLREFRRESKRLIRCVDKKRNNFRCLHHDH
jgi:hypothetical protein